jgi:hypothetical protein
MKAILTGCAIAALLVGSAAAQGRGVGLGGGIGAGVGGGVGVGGGIGGIGGIGVGAGINTGPSARAPDIATGRANTATTVRGAADVLPNTRASAQGQTSGSRSSANTAADASSPASANAADPSDRAGERRAATTDIRAGALVKSTRGSTLGRIESVTPATGGAAAMVTIRSGAETWTLPQSEINASGDFLVTSHRRP